jgi:hypothetical protein
MLQMGDAGTIPAQRPCRWLDGSTLDPQLLVVSSRDVPAGG